MKLSVKDKTWCIVNAQQIVFFFLIQVSKCERQSKMYCFPDRLCLYDWAGRL